jgi:hypothetical protein
LRPDRRAPTPKLGRRPANDLGTRRNGANSDPIDVRNRKIDAEVGRPIVLGLKASHFGVFIGKHRAGLADNLGPRRTLPSPSWIRSLDRAEAFA